jgi:hypothetical protein
MAPTSKKMFLTSFASQIFNGFLQAGNERSLGGRARGPPGGHLTCGRQAGVRAEGRAERRMCTAVRRERCQLIELQLLGSA